MSDLLTNPLGTPLLVTLTVVEIVVLVAVLATFVLVLTRRLRSIADTLGNLASGVRAVERDVNLIGPGVTRLNGTMTQIANALPGIAEKAEGLAAKR